MLGVWLVAVALAVTLPLASKWWVLVQKSVSMQTAQLNSHDHEYPAPPDHPPPPSIFDLRGAGVLLVLYPIPHLLLLLPLRVQLPRARDDRSLPAALHALLLESIRGKSSGRSGTVDYTIAVAAFLLLFLKRLTSKHTYSNAKFCFVGDVSKASVVIPRHFPVR